ncbi:MAG: hypothetical protein LBD15_03985 [Holosporales bacterium]|jgi:hypothetical protein|nr:hypothetical protein [Holosporales bacterium]
MGITYRHIKGAPLTSAEVDANFENLEKRLLAIENQKTSPTSLLSIEQHDARLRFLGPSGRILGEAELPVQRFIPKGGWQTMQVYARDDLVAHESHTWCAMRAHESKDFEEDKRQGLWKIFL